MKRMLIAALLCVVSSTTLLAAEPEKTEAPLPAAAPSVAPPPPVPNVQPPSRSSPPRETRRAPTPEADLDKPITTTLRAQQRIWNAIRVAGKASCEQRAAQQDAEPDIQDLVRQATPADAPAH